ncbi:MAG: type IV conjugative transfer system protein TraE, partial [Burkholderiales bacterium]|nr:type IV conjugative transfer system protein TraE [Burkholderiales bacterium]
NWISNNKISNEYMEIMSRNLLSLTLDVSPETVKSQYDAFLRFVTPDLRSYIVENLKKSSENIINNDIAQSFYIDTIKVVPMSQTTYVVGNLATYINNQQVTNIHQLYKIKYATDDMTVKIKEYRLLDPQKDAAELKGIGL